MAQTTKGLPRKGDIWKAYYTDGRYEDTYYLILGDPIAKMNGVTVYRCTNLNFGVRETLHYFPNGERQADDGVLEIMEFWG